MEASAMSFSACSRSIWVHVNPVSSPSSGLTSASVSISPTSTVSVTPETSSAS